MNFRMIGQVIGRVLCIEAALMLLPMVAALAYGESPAPFLITIAVTGGIGLVMWRVRAKSGGITARDGFLIVGLSWIAMSLFGALLFVLTGDIPNYVDALFETISGLTTTGASVVTAPEEMTRGGMFWRLFTHWIGGMGILVFVLAVLPMSGNRSMHIMRAEVPGPTVGKLVPRIRKTASILYLLYIALTLVEMVLLIAGGMSFYDALLHAFATAGTGGLSTRALSIGYYNSAYIDIVVGVFMILFGANFSLYYLILLGNIRTALRNEELRWYLGVIAFAVITIAVDIRNLYGGVGHALRYSFFQVASIISTTGFATADFNLWPEYSKFLLVLLMFVGGCAGSTAGGLKLSRVILLFKSCTIEVKKMLRPRCVENVRLDGKPVDGQTVYNAMTFFTFYIIILLIAGLIVSLDGLDFTTNFTAALSCLSNAAEQDRAHDLHAARPSGDFPAAAAVRAVHVALEVSADPGCPIWIMMTPAVQDASCAAGAFLCRDSEALPSGSYPPSKKYYFFDKDNPAGDCLRGCLSMTLQAQRSVFLNWDAGELRLRQITPTALPSSRRRAF